MRPRVLAPAAVLAVLLLAMTGCGGGGGDSGGGGGGGRPFVFSGGGGKDDSSRAPAALGFPGFATKNTTRVAGGDAIQDAAAVALAVFPAQSKSTRPATVALADGGDWRTATAAAALMAPPVRAPLLLSKGTDLTDPTSKALDALGPPGSDLARRAQVIAVGVKPKEAGGRRVALLSGKDVAAQAGAVDRFLTSVRGKPSDSVVVVGDSDPKFGVPAAAWAAKSGDPVLFVTKDSIPNATRISLAAHGKPRIYVLGPESTVGPKAFKLLQGLGTVVRISGPDPVQNAIAFARYKDGDFGWGVTDPGHSFEFINQDRPVDGPASAALASTGQYGPLLLTQKGEKVSRPLISYLLDIQPGYRSDPVRGVYNRGWIIGGGDAISLAAQARIDELLEIQPVSKGG